MPHWGLTPSSRSGQLFGLTILAVLLYVGAAAGLSAIPGYAEMRPTLAGVRWPWVLASLGGSRPPSRATCWPGAASSAVLAQAAH